MYLYMSTYITKRLFNIGKCSSLNENTENFQLTLLTWKANKIENSTDNTFLVIFWKISQLN